MQEASLKINEIYLSVQGESSYAGLPCIFVRLTACDLRCSYCDTPYAFLEGESMDIQAIIDRVVSFECKLVEITGGEPLLQKNILPLMSGLCDRGFTVLLETSGAHDISVVDPRVVRIMDLKSPGSGEFAKNRYENIGHLQSKDEVKFVIGSREDYEWSRAIIEKYALDRKVKTILFSPVFRHPGMMGQTTGHPGIDPKLVVEWLLEDQLPVRFQLQLHKFIWPPEQRGV